MAPHAGLAHAHPMAAGHPLGQGMMGVGQPGVSMGPQAHPGMSGAGGAQVSQAGPMMAGIPQMGGPNVSGVGPNAHALSHLTPGHPQMYNQGSKYTALILR